MLKLGDAALWRDVFQRKVKAMLKIKMGGAAAAGGFAGAVKAVAEAVPAEDPASFYG